MPIGSLIWRAYNDLSNTCIQLAIKFPSIREEELRLLLVLRFGCPKLELGRLLQTLKLNISGAFGQFFERRLVLDGHRGHIHSRVNP